MAFEFSSSRYSILSSSEDLRVAERTRDSSAEYTSFLNTEKTIRHNVYDLRKRSASDECMPRPAQCSRSDIHYPTNPFSGHPKSPSHIHTSKELTFISKLDDRTFNINEFISSSTQHPSTGDSHTSTLAAKGCYRYVSLPAYISVGQDKEPTIPLSGVSFTLDSFMDIESVDENLEVALECDTPVSVFGNDDRTSSVSGVPSFSNAFRLSSLTNGASLLSIFEFRNKHQPIAQIPPHLATFTKPKRRGFSYLNLKNPCTIPPERCEEKSPSLLDQRPRPVQKKVFPAMRKRVSAVFRTELWPQTPHTVNQYSSHPGTSWEPEIGTHGQHIANPARSIAPAVTPTAQIASCDQLYPSFPSEVSFNNNIPSSREEKEIIGPEKSNSLSYMLEALSLFKDKPLPGIPIEKDADCHNLIAEGENDVDDTGSASSWLESGTECLTILNGKWPEPPRHMIFLDPNMVEIFRYNQPESSDERMDISPIMQNNSRDNTTYKIHDVQIKPTHLDVSVEELLSSVKIYLNGSRIFSQPFLPNTLIFPSVTTVDPTELGYTVELVIRAPVISHLISFCTLYTDTTLTFEQQAHPLSMATKMQVEISMNKGNLTPLEESFQELSIAIRVNDNQSETIDFSDTLSEGERPHKILIELPCTLGELATIITKLK